MKKILLFVLIVTTGIAEKTYGQALLRLDSLSSFGIKYDVLGPKHQVIVGYNIINVSTNDADSLTRGAVFYTNLRINTQKAISKSKGKIIHDNLKPYKINKDFIIVYDTIILNDSISVPSFGTNVIVIWPTGNGVHAMFLTNPHAFQITYTDIAEASTPENSLKIYPNPATDIIRFEMMTQGKNLQRVIIRDISGKELINETHIENEMNISALPKGCYILTTYFSDGSTGIYKLIRIE